MNEKWSPEKIAKAKELFGLDIIKKTERQIRWTTSCDSVLLHDRWSPYRSYTIIPYFCYWNRGRPFGIVRNLISPQEQHNKLASQELHIVNTTANSGWIVEDDSLTSHTNDELKDEGSKTGLVLTYKKNRQPPQKIQANQIPTGIDRVVQLSSNNIKEISGVH